MIFLLLAVLALYSGIVPTKPERPNVVVIVVSPGGLEPDAGAEAIPEGAAPALDPDKPSASYTRHHLTKQRRRFREISRRDSWNIANADANSGHALIVPSVEP